jgi:acetyltransferase-like isoleucine patch superfamily enzyme
MSLMKLKSKKYFTILAKRPLLAGQYVRSVLLFYFTLLLRCIKEVPGTNIGSNVRLQRYSSLRTELPNAEISVGTNTIIYESSMLEAYDKGQISVGNNCVLAGVRFVSRDKITIGNSCLLSWGVYIQDFDPHPVNPTERQEQVKEIIGSFVPSFTKNPFNSRQINLDNANFSHSFNSSSVKLGDNVWVGANATILKGAKIGSGSIIATGAVVPGGEYPENSLIAGNPARVLKSLL